MCLFLGIGLIPSTLLSRLEVVMLRTKGQSHLRTANEGSESLIRHFLFIKSDGRTVFNLLTD